MKAYGKLIAPALAILLLAGCGNGLSPSLRRDISSENDKVLAAERQVRKSQAALNSNLAQAPDLFRNASEVTDWKASISSAEADLQLAQANGRELVRFIEDKRPDVRIPALLADEKRLREAALEKTGSVDGAVSKWLDYRRDPEAFAGTVHRERAAIQAFDLAPVKQAVVKAEVDWPAKKVVLEKRISSLLNSTKTAEQPTETTPSILIAEENALSRQEKALIGGSQQLQNECGQLYDSWDKLLTDLDRSDLGGDTLYRERLKIVRTHFSDVPSKMTETHSEERWTDVSEADYHTAENDIGMVMAHKDAGLFDSEAQNTPQPPGFSYVASPSVGSNQYGYWTHRGNESVWTFLPQYLILRELLWNHDYHPVMAAEYNAYRVAQNRGTTYYGRETPTAAPKYGTHGTFTQTHYADSRYVQSGGFKGSAYASGSTHNSGSGFLNRLRPESSGQSAMHSDSGKRFGKQPGAAPLGQRFGHSPSSRPLGRSFGRRR